MPVTTNDSILNSVKKVLGIDPSYDAFDLDITMHINSVFLALQQIGVGPVQGFFITDDTQTWADFLGTNPILNATRSYVYLKVRSIFDPPSVASAMTAMDKMAAELEWRLMVAVDTRPSMYEPNEAVVWELSDPDEFPPEASPGEVGIDPVTGDVWMEE